MASKKKISAGASGAPRAPAPRAPRSRGINLKKLAHDLEREIREREKALALPQLNDEIGTRHLMWMCRQIYNGWIPDSLAPIWIGYVQGVFRAGGGPNVKELAEMIRQALEEDDRARLDDAAGAEPSP